MRWINIIALYLLAGSVAGIEYYTADGRPVQRRSGETREPIGIVDTVAIVAGYGSLTLSDEFGKGKHSVTPSSELTIQATITQILDDSTKTIYYYSYEYRHKERRFIIKSSNVADTGKVAIFILVR